MVQRAPPEPESRSSSNNGQRQNNNESRGQGGRIQYRGLRSNAMYLGAMSVPAEMVEGTGKFEFYLKDRN